MSSIAIYFLIGPYLYLARKLIYKSRAFIIERYWILHFVWHVRIRMILNKEEHVPVQLTLKSQSDNNYFDNLKPGNDQ